MKTKVFFVCAAGAFVGALIALQLAPVWCWLGIIVGALVSYLVYDLPGVIRAVPTAWKRSRIALPTLLQGSLRFLLISFLVLLVLVNLAAIIFVGFALVMTGGYIATEVAQPGSWLVGVGWTIAVSPLIMISAVLFNHSEGVAGTSPFVFLTLPLVNLMPEADGNPGTYLTSPWGILNTLLFILLAPICTLLAALAIVISIIWGMVLLVLGLGRFVKHLFILIHSDLRLLCAIDAALGAGIGYATGNVLLGALAGGIIGVLNYEIISRRLLKLVPIAGK